jgi:uncharacterized damage-inducible protein DinB
LGHIVGAEWIWLRRWLGDNPTAAPGWVAESSLSELRDRLAAVEAEREQFLTQLADDDLQRIVEYRRLSGEAHADRLADLVRQVVNHSTYHRGQVATQLRHIGVNPPTRISSTTFAREVACGVPRRRDAAAGKQRRRRDT